MSVSVILACAAAALAVKPGTWLHQSEADFSAGKLENAVVTNLGDVQLAHETQALAELEGDDSIVYDLARLGDGRVLLAVGPTGKLAVLEGKKAKDVETYSGAQVFALAADKGGVWVGVSGAPSRVEYRSDKDLKVQRTIELKDVRYIWDLVLDGDKLALATGTTGQVLVLNTKDKEPKPVVALKAKQANILCLGVDSEHRLYAGTDADGLVYRLTPSGNSYKSFVLYDAGEPEIGALLVLEDGTLYVGTADAEQAKPGRLAEAQVENTGRPERPPVAEKEAKLPNVPPKPDPKQPAEKSGGKTDVKSEGKSAAPKTEAKSDAKSESKAEPKAEPKPDAAGPTGNEKPTPEQYQQLREAVSQKLEQARESGRITLQQSGKTTSSTSRLRTSSTKMATSSKSGSGKSSKAGNAIYRIDTQGYVNEVFRESVMILRMARQGSALIVATGNEGELYRVDPDAAEVSLLANLDPQQVPALLSDDKGGVLVGTANPGRVLKLADAVAKSGTITSVALDATQVSRFGKLTVMGDAPEGTSIEVQTRSGNVSDVDSGSWSEWSKGSKLTFDGGRSGYVDVESPTARYLQYRITLKSDGKATPSVDVVSLKYLMPNLQPAIASVKAEYAGGKGGRLGGGTDTAAGAEGPKPLSTVKVDWEATDPNADKMKYVVEYRPYGSQQPWVKIADDLDSNSFEWDTRTVPDGRYTLRVTASDAVDNIGSEAKKTTRISDPVVVDNTPPTIKTPTVEQSGPKTLTVKTLVTDNLTAITDFRYAVNSGKDWKLVLPEDAIFDSTSESILFKIPDLSTGAHVLTLRAVDSQGNARYVSTPFSIK